MASKLILNAIPGLKKTDNSHPVRPRRPENLSLWNSWGTGPWSPVVSPKPPSATKSLPIEALTSQALRSVERAQSFPHSTLSTRPPPSLTQREHLKHRPSPSPASRPMEERLAQLEIENASLRSANDVLYKQNSDYRELVQNYRQFQGAATSVIDGHIGLVEVLEDITRDVRSDARAYNLVRSKLQRVERGKIRDWRNFVNAKAEAGIHVQAVVKDVVDKHSMETRTNVV